MNTQNEQDVTPSEFVAAAVASYDRLPESLRAELIESEAMEQVAQAWLDAGMDDALRMVPALIEILELLMCGEDLVESAKRAEQRRLDWRGRKQQAVNKIREAAELLQGDPPVDIRPTRAIKSGKDGGLVVNLKGLKAESRGRKREFMTPEQTDRDLAYNLRDAQIVQWLADMGHLDIALQNVADALESAKVSPISTRIHYPISTDHIGKRGRAAKSSSAFNGVVVKEIHCRLPISLRDNYALIAKLASHVGVDVSRQGVRGILLGGQT